MVKLSSKPQTTLGLIITVFLKLFKALISPLNFYCWYFDFESLLAPIAETWINFFTLDPEQYFEIISGKST